MKRVLLFIASFVMVSILMSACSSVSTLVAPENSVSGSTNYPAPGEKVVAAYPAQSGMGTEMTYPYPKVGNVVEKGQLSGSIFVLPDSKPLISGSIYLVRGTGDQANVLPADLKGPNAERGDIVGGTDPQGEFEIQNIQAGNYFLVVVKPSGDLGTVQTSESEQTPLLIKILDGQTQALGKVFVR